MEVNEFHCVSIKDGCCHVFMWTCTRFFTKSKDTFFRDEQAFKPAALVNIITYF